MKNKWKVSILKNCIYRIGKHVLKYVTRKLIYCHISIDFIEFITAMYLVTDRTMISRTKMIDGFINLIRNVVIEQ